MTGRLKLLSRGGGSSDCFKGDEKQQSTEFQFAMQRNIEINLRTTDFGNNDIFQLMSADWNFPNRLENLCTYIVIQGKREHC
jgi:hypothetical protein